MAEGLALKGYTVEILTEHIFGRDEKEIHNGVSIRRFKHKSFLKFNFGDKHKYQAFLSNQLKRTDVLITVCAQSFISEWFFPIIDEVPAIKIMYMHGMRKERIDLNHIYSKKNFFRESLLTIWWNIYFKKNWRAISKYNACVHLFNNDNSYNYFESKGFKNNFTIENSCEEIFFEDQICDQVPDQYGIKNQYFVLVANFDANKNQMLALKSFIKANLETVDLVFIGSIENDFTKKLREYLDEIDIKFKKSVHILTGISRSDTIQLIKSCFACLLSSYTEYFPISLIEGMACGKPFISTSVGEVPKLVGGHIASNESEMSYWIKYFANHPCYVERLGNAAREFAKEKMFLKDKIDQLEELILRTSSRMQNNF